MVSNEELWKRDDDKRWRERTDERLASLTNGEIVQNDRLDAIQEQLRDLDQVLRGDPEKDTGGIVEHLHELQVGITSLRTIMAPDALGGGGVLNRLKALEKKEEREQRQTEYKWKFRIALIGLVSAATVAIVTNFDRIGTFWRREMRTETTLEQKINRAKHPKGKRRRIVVPKEDDDAADEGMPEVR